MVRTNKTIAANFLNAIGSGDVETVRRLAAQDLVFVTAGKSKASGTYDLETLARLLAVFPAIMSGGGIRFEFLNFTAEDDRVACEARGYAKVISGEEYNNEYHFLITLRDGKISRLVEYLDTTLVETVLLPHLRKL
jgi:hypothetical protein